MTKFAQEYQYETKLDSIAITCQKINLLTDDSSSEIVDFVNTISRNPELTDTILRIANEAYSEMTGVIQCISKAVTLIGIGQIPNLINSIYATNEVSSSLNILPFQSSKPENKPALLPPLDNRDKDRQKL